MVHFDECEHKWVFQTNATNNTMIWRTTFQCKNCNQCITLEEKCALEQNKALQDSALIQERNTRIAMWGVIISTASCLIALFVFLFGDKTLFLQ